MSGDVQELLAMLPWGVLAGFVGRLLHCLGRAVVDEVVRPVLRSVGRCWSARIEARWMPPDRGPAPLQARGRGSTPSGGSSPLA
jgi:hypothetical protein